MKVSLKRCEGNAEDWSVVVDGDTVITNETYGVCFAVAEQLQRGWADNTEAGEVAKRILDIQGRVIRNLAHYGFDEEAALAAAMAKDTFHHYPVETAGDLILFCMEWDHPDWNRVYLALEDKEPVP